VKLSTSSLREWNSARNLPSTICHIDTEVMPRDLAGRKAGIMGPYVVPSRSYFVLGDNGTSLQTPLLGTGLNGNLVLGKAIRYISDDLSRSAAQFL